jgi:hypothetical protein
VQFYTINTNKPKKTKLNKLAMAIKSYILTQDFSAPYVVATGLPHDPQKIKIKKFGKGEIVKGEMKHANNQPAFVLVNGVLVLPLEVIKELVTKAIVDNDTPPIPVDVEPQNASEVLLGKKKTAVPTNPKVRYIDTMVIGGLIGLGGVYLAGRQGWIAEMDKKYYLYGFGLGAIAGAYFVYRTKAQEVQKTIALKKADKE